VPRWPYIGVAKFSPFFFFSISRDGFLPLFFPLGARRKAIKGFKEAFQKYQAPFFFFLDGKEAPAPPLLSRRHSQGSRPKRTFLKKDPLISDRKLPEAQFPPFLS